MLNRATEFLDFIIRDRLSFKDNLNVVDATAGNGNDSLKILQTMNSNCFLTGFDIQNSAITNTDNLLKSQGFHNYKLILDGHENIDKYFFVDSVDFIIYNLGYLPKGDKNIYTYSFTTIGSLEKSMRILKRGGMISIATYPGYEAGKNEHVEVLEFLKDIGQKEFNVFHGNFINQKNNPPNLFLIERR